MSRTRTPIEFYDVCYKAGLRGFMRDSNIIYGGSRSKSIMDCDICGWSLYRVSKLFINGNAKCPICNDGTVVNMDEWFTKQAYNGSDIFDLIDFREFEWRGATKKSWVTCKICDHGWKTSPDKLNQGRRCPECAKIQRGLSHRTPLKELIELFQSIHKNPDGSPKYGYDRVTSNLLSDYQDIYCFACGKYFSQQLALHKGGCGCSGCNMLIQSERQTKSLEQFIKDTESEHGVGRYGYFEVVYINAIEPIKIWCYECEKFFWRSPNSHLSGCGCPDCGHDFTDPNYTHYIYQMTCDINNWIYVGRHSTKRKDLLNDGYMGGGTELKKAQKLYGMSHFHKEILYTTDTHSNLKILENTIVDDEFLSRDDVYNQRRGG